MGCCHGAARSYAAGDEGTEKRSACSLGSVEYGQRKGWGARFVPCRRRHSAIVLEEDRKSWKSVEDEVLAKMLGSKCLKTQELLCLGTLTS